MTTTKQIIARLRKFIDTRIQASYAVSESVDEHDQVLKEEQAILDTYDLVSGEISQIEKEITEEKIHNVGIEQIRRAINLNFIVTISPRRGVTFKRGNREIWSVIDDYQIFWQTADLINEYYRNHKTADNLDDAMDRDNLLVSDIQGNFYK